MPDKLISLNAALDAFGLSEKTRKYGGDHSGYSTMMLYEIQDTLEELPTAGPEWTPCTELLPEAYQWVLVSTDYDVDRMYLTSGGYWSDGVGNLEAPGYALAWMPLPKRWKGEK